MTSIKSATIVGLLKVAGLGELVAFAAIKARSGPDGWCRKSVPQLAELLQLHPTTARQRMKTLAALGYVREHPVHTLARMAHEVIEPDYGAAVEFDPANLCLGDALAVWLLLIAMGREFTSKLDDVAAMAGVSRDTLDMHLRRLIDAKLVTLTRASRSEYKVEANVKLRTPEKSVRVSHADSRPESSSRKWDVIAAQVRAKIIIHPTH